MIFGDLDILSRTIWGEARSESYKGMKAVAHVVLNRAKKSGRTVSSECLRRKQFSCWNKSDPNLEKMLNVDLMDKTYRQCMRAALEAVDERDFTKGSRHYCTRAVHPAWAEGHTPVLRLGAHVFFAGIK